MHVVIIIVKLKVSEEGTLNLHIGQAYTHELVAVSPLALRLAHSFAIRMFFRFPVEKIFFFGRLWARA